MIYYRPTEGDPLTARLRKRPRACFLMTQLGGPIPPILTEIRTALTEVVQRERFELIDADSLVTGRLRRAYLLTGDEALKDRARATFDAAGLSERAKNSVEMLLIDFD